MARTARDWAKAKEGLQEQEGEAALCSDFCPDFFVRRTQMFQEK